MNARYRRLLSQMYLLLVVLVVPVMSRAATTVAVELVTSGLSQPVALTVSPDDTQRLFVAERNLANIRVIKNGKLRSRPFLNIASKVNSENIEQGLLGLAFHPNYRKNGFFYVNYTNKEGDTVIERYSVSERRNLADETSGTVILTVNQPRDYHNGGTIAFGPNDHCLYVGMGDGGLALGDNISMKSPLGKILRIDVDSNAKYSVPADNPFVGNTDVNPIVWASGVRNPWGMCFDPLNGDLWFGDVGEVAREEINLQRSSSRGGENYGWPIAEGFVCKGGNGTCGTNPGFTPPIYDYGRETARCVIGGRVYRGSAMPGLQGTYFFADFFLPIWSVRYDGSEISPVIDRTAELDPPGPAHILSIAAFGQDSFGELYILDMYAGAVYKLVPNNKISIR